MKHDLMIRGGLIADGAGSEPYLAEIAIDRDTITAIGEIEGEGVREIAADGHAVTPGFIALHTHLDAQAGRTPAPDTGPLARHHDGASRELRCHLRTLHSCIQ